MIYLAKFIYWVGVKGHNLPGIIHIFMIMENVNIYFGLFKNMLHWIHVDCDGGLRYYNSKFHRDLKQHIYMQIDV